MLFFLKQKVHSWYQNKERSFGGGVLFGKAGKYSSGQQIFTNIKK